MSSDNKAEIVIDGNATGWRRAMQEVVQTSQQGTRQVEDHFGRLSRVFEGVQGKIAAIGATIGTALSGVAFGAGIKSAIDQADALNELADRSGLAIETLARLKFAGQENGVSMDVLGDAVKRLSKVMIEAGANDDEATRKLKAFGVTLEQIKTADTEGALRRIADTIAALPEAARQGAIENLAKGMGQLVPMLKDGAAGLDALFHKADELKVTDGFVAAAKVADEFNDKLDELSQTFTGVMQRAGASVLPALTEMTEGFGKTLLAVEKSKDSLMVLGTAVLGGVVTNALRSLAINLTESASNWLTAMQATRQDMAAKVANAQSTANSARALQAHAAMLVQEAEAAVASASGMARLTVVQNTLIPARARLAAATEAATIAERALAAAKAETATKATLTGAALSAMGGPLGAIVTLIGVGATAWLAFGRNGLTAVNSVTQEIERGREVMARYQREQKFGTGDEGQLRASLEAIEGRISVLTQSSGRSPAAAAELGRLRKEAEALQATLDEIEARRTSNDKDAAARADALKKLLAALEKPEKPEKKAHQPTDPSLMAYYEAALSEEKRLAAERDALREYTKQEELAFWQTLLQYADLNSKDRVAIEKKASDLVVQIRREEAKQQMALTAEHIRFGESLQNGQLDAKRAAARLALDLDQITKAEYLQAEEVFENERWEIQRKALEERLSLLQADPNTNPAEYARLKNQILELEQQHQLKLQEIHGQQTVENENGGLFGNIGAAFSRGLDQMLTRAENWKQALLGIFNSVRDAFLQEVVYKNVQEFIAGLARKLAATIGFETAEKAAITSNALAKRAEAQAVVPAEAAMAAGGAATAVASIPIVGPEMATVAYNTIYAMVMGGLVVPSAAGGYDIPRGLNPLTQLHEQEMVLPASIAEPLRTMIANGAAWQGGGPNIRVVNTLHPSIAGEYIESSEGEHAILNVIRRNPDAVKQILD